MSKVFSFLKIFHGKLILRIFGWKMEGEIPKASKYVAVIAPHTSYVDMFVGKLYNWATDMKPTIMVKKEFFFFPANLIIKAWGGIPINRKNARNIITQMADLFNEKKEMVLAITPEGTRAKTNEWKTGFYRIAVKANVPIYLLFIDFKKKTLGYLCEFIPTGNMEEDMKSIKQKYEGVTAYHSKKFSVSS